MTAEIFDLSNLDTGESSTTKSDADLSEDDVPRSYDKYEERYVAFIDILGFKELIKRSEKELAHDCGADDRLHSVSAIFNALYFNLSSINDTYQIISHDTQSPDLRLNTFSDFVIISSNPTPPGLDALIFAVWSVITEWLSKGYISRGGISKGKIVHRYYEDGRAPIVFGPAFISAYLLETEIADYPRVVLSKDVRLIYSEIKQNGEGTIRALQKLVRQHDDGPHWIDIFGHIRKDGFDKLAQDMRTEAEQYARTLKQHLDEGSDNPKLYRKTRWLVERFNEAIISTTYADLEISLQI
jgi:hypothetical protein